MRYKLTQLKNLCNADRIFPSNNTLSLGGAIAAHQAGILNLEDHMHFMYKEDLSPHMWCGDDWCIAEMGDDE